MVANQNVTTIRIPEFFRTHELRFNAEYVEYRKTRIYWHDLTGFRCKGTETKWNYLPPSEIEIEWLLKSADADIIIMFGGGMFSIAEKREVYQQLVTIAQRYVLPALIKRYLQQIAESDAPVDVAGIGLSREGIHHTKNRLFRSPLQYFVSWSQFVALTQEYSHFFIYDWTALSSDDENPKHAYDTRHFLFAVPVRKSEYNWMIIPDIICHCAKAFGKMPSVWIDDRRISLAGPPAR